MSGSGELLNTEEVDFLLEASAKGPDSATTPEDEGGEQLVTMRGDLDQINLADIFQTLAMTKMEGMLKVSNPIEQRHVWFKNGFVRILVPNRVATRRLGQRLVQAGLLQSDQLRMTLLEQRKDARPLGVLLVEKQLVTDEQIDEIVGAQVTEELFALFTWRHGVFEFYKGEVTDPALRQQLDQVPEFEVNSLMLEVARRSDEWEGIVKELGSLDEIPTRVGEPDDADLTDEQRTILRCADGRLTYREIAEQGMLPLFDGARAARDLVRQGAIGSIDDEAALALARGWVDENLHKRSLMVVQMLRDRPGERSLPVIEALADVLRQCGEQKLASHWLIELAQLQTDGAVALDLARKARALFARDAGTLSFLRTTMLAHSSPTSEELEAVTVELLDALLDKNDTARVLELADDARKTGTATPAVLLRLARALQKRRELPATITVLLEIAALHEAAGRKAQVVETYEQIVRIDRSRKDLLKQLRQLKATRTTRLIRLAAAVLVLGMIGAAGFVWFDQNRTETNLRAAATEIGGLLRSGDRVAAKEALDRWRDVLGAVEQLDDLHSQIMFADAAEHARLRQQERKRVSERMGQAAQLLSEGDVAEALAVYGGLLDRKDLAEEVRDTVTARLNTLAEEIDQADKSLAAMLPPAPSRRLERAQLEEALNGLRACTRPHLVTVLQKIGDDAQLPAWIPTEVKNRLLHAVADARPRFSQLATRTQEYEAAAARADNERRLDPLFKQAMDLERKFDFPGALAAYRRLETEHTGEAGLKAHFRDQVERYATICRLLDAVAQATAAADFPTAQQQYRALQAAFPALPFERLARLPMTIETSPPGATVSWNGIEAGRTPCVVAYVPGDRSSVVLRLDGFLAEHATVNGDQIGLLRSLMTCKPDWWVELPGVVDQPTVMDERGRIFAVDRSGTLNCVEAQSGRIVWQKRAEDLSGLLTTPLLAGELVLVGSYDGPLRAFERTNGRPVWTSENFGTELPIRRFGDAAVIATLDRRLALVDLATGQPVRQTQLDAAPRGDLLVIGRRAVVALVGGAITAVPLDNEVRGWRQQWPDAGDVRLAIADGTLAVAGEDGSVRGVDPERGEPRWRCDLGDNATAIHGHGGHFAIALETRQVLVDGKSGDEAVSASMEGVTWSGTPALTTSRLLGSRKDGTVAVCQRTDGKALFLLRATRPVTQVTTVGNGAIVGSADRRLALYRRLP